MNKIQLESLSNTRDLGGYKTIDGKTVKNKRIIRSGELYNANQDDLATLTNDYHLAKIIDLRTYLEVEQKPDPTLNGVNFVHAPLFESFEKGITREEHKEQKNFTELEKMIAMIKSMNCECDKVMIELYPHFLHDDFAIKHFKIFFNEVINQDEGSILFHCSQGKDRAGTAAMLLLASLGVDEQTVEDDYLATNICYKDKIDNLMSEARALNYDEKIISQIPYTQGVNIDFIGALYETIEKEYSTVDNYLKQAIGLTDNDLDKLKSNYLE